MKRRKRLSLCILLSAAVVLSCSFNNRTNRKLIRGIIENKEAFSLYTSTEQSPEVFEKTKINVVDSIVLPAKMSYTSEQILHRKGYITSYNAEHKIPNWVAWHLTATHTKGPYKRSAMKFHEDKEVEGPSVTTEDYARSGYDRGHMCPAGDNKWNEQALEESFLMTNICPQAHNLNTGDWNDLENKCRSWAKKYGDIYIVCGPILRNLRHRRIGKHHVTVPEAFFKVILCMRGKPKAIGFVYENEDGHKPIAAYSTTIDVVEKATGINFFPVLPDDIENKVEASADYNQW